MKFIKYTDHGSTKFLNPAHIVSMELHKNASGKSDTLSIMMTKKAPLDSPSINISRDALGPVIEQLTQLGLIDP